MRKEGERGEKMGKEAIRYGKSAYNIIKFNRVGRDDVTTGKLFPSRGECLGLYRCVLIIFKRK